MPEAYTLSHSCVFEPQIIAGGESGDPNEDALTEEERE